MSPQAIRVVRIFFDIDRCPGWDFALALTWGLFAFVAIQRHDMPWAVFTAWACGVRCARSGCPVDPSARPRRSPAQEKK